MKQVFVIFSFVSYVFAKSYSILGIECTSSGKTLVYLICTRDQAQKTFLIETNITQPVNNFIVRIHEKQIFIHILTLGLFQATATLHVYVGSKYKQMFKFSDVDWCKFMSKSGNQLNPTMKLVVNAFKKSCPNLLHKCPYYGLYPSNITIPNYVISFIPPGLYKLTLEAYNEFDEDFFHTTSSIEILDGS